MGSNPICSTMAQKVYDQEIVENVERLYKKHGNGIPATKLKNKLTEHTNATKKTIKKHLRTLTEQGRLQAKNGKYYPPEKKQSKETILEKLETLKKQIKRDREAIETALTEDEVEPWVKEQGVQKLYDSLAKTLLGWEKQLERLRKLEEEEPEHCYFAEPYHEKVQKTLWDVPEMQCMFESQDNANLATLLLEIRDNQEKILEKLGDTDD